MLASGVIGPGETFVHKLRAAAAGLYALAANAAPGAFNNGIGSSPSACATA